MITHYLAIALMYPATTYGWGEIMCGDVDNPMPCVAGTTTASGDLFDPELPSAAVPAPFNLRMKSKVIWIRNEHGECKSITLNDKKNPRYVGNGGLDLSRGAIEMLFPSVASRSWSGKVEVCDVRYTTEEVNL